VRYLRREDLTLRLRSIGGGLAILTLGCSDSTGPGGPTFEFTTEVVFGVRTVAPALSVVRRQIVVSGVLSAPHTGFTVAGTFDQPAPELLVMTVHLDQVGVGAPFRTQHAYSGRVIGLAKGNYDLTFNIVSATDTTLTFTEPVTLR
jgi:hypothetical protein